MLLSTSTFLVGFCALFIPLGHVTVSTFMSTSSRLPTMNVYPQTTGQVMTTHVDRYSDEYVDRFMNTSTGQQFLKTAYLETKVQ
jgi:hypothetical protein